MRNASFAILASLLIVGPAHPATITIVNNDGAGEGFNDTTAATPVGGNDGVTVGEQRLNVFARAAEIWGAKLESSVEILVAAQFDSLECDPTSGVLGSAGALSVNRDFDGAPLASTWYPIALANALFGADADGANPDISATFNSDLGTAGCLTSLNWYYGLDGNAPTGTIDLLDVLLHELGHGLGFQTYVGLSTGRKFGTPAYNDVFMSFLKDMETGETYPQMTNSERVAASQNVGNLVWTGANVTANAGILTGGLNSGFVEMYAPSPQEPGSSVSHFSTALSPNELMEPFATATSDRTLTTELFRDIGWTIISENTSPVTLEDAFIVENGGTATTLDDGETSVVANDLDLEADTLSAIAVTLTANGTLTLNTDGTFSYTHDGSATTTDSFTYRANDGTINGTLATVSITINTRDSWFTSNFSAADLDDPAKEDSVWGNSANPDGDALDNLMEYALALDPNDSTDAEDAIALVVAESATPGEFLHTMTFTRRTNDGSLSIHPEVSGDAVNWSGDSADVAQVGSGTPAGANAETVTFQDQTPVTPDTPRFFRLRVVYPDE